MTSPMIKILQYRVAVHAAIVTVTAYAMLEIRQILICISKESEVLNWID